MGSATSTTAPKRVAVIGGGASGLVSLEEALEKGLEAQLFEARDEVGGAWILSEDPGACLVSFDADGNATLQAPGENSAGSPPATPMYPGLHTNVPSTLMEYRARPFPPTVVCPSLLKLWLPSSRSRPVRSAARPIQMTLELQSHRS